MKKITTESGNYLIEITDEDAKEFEQTDLHSKLVSWVNEDPEWLLNMVEEKIDEIYLAYQEKVGITEGRMYLGDVLELDEIQHKVAKFVVKSMKDAPRERGV